VDAAASGACGVRRAVIREWARRADERRLNASCQDFDRSHMAGRRSGEGSCGRQNRVVLAPVAGVKPAEVCGARPGDASRQFAGDGGKRNSSPGRARHKPLKPLRGESRVLSGATVVTTVCIFRTRAAGAPGTRLSLRLLTLGDKEFTHSPGASCRGIASLGIAMTEIVPARPAGRLTFRAGPFPLGRKTLYGGRSLRRQRGWIYDKYQGLGCGPCLWRVV
jgi:hypothetical protein